MNLRTEPVRIIMLLAALFATVGPCLVAIGEGVDPLVAVGSAIAAFGALLGGEEFARSQVRPEVEHQAKIDEVVSAETVIAEAERGGHR